MLSSPRARKIVTVFAVGIAILVGAYFYAVTPHHSFAPPESAGGLLDRADSLAWGNRWTDAQPLYKKAQHLFAAQKQTSKAL
jgi:hypothetical protein